MVRDSFLYVPDRSSLRHFLHLHDRLPAAIVFTHLGLDGRDQKARTWRKEHFLLTSQHGLLHDINTCPALVDDEQVRLVKSLLARFRRAEEGRVLEFTTDHKARVVSGQVRAPIHLALLVFRHLGQSPNDGDDAVLCRFGELVRPQRAVDLAVPRAGIILNRLVVTVLIFYAVK
jgi:hypothetical protein